MRTRAATATGAAVIALLVAAAPAGAVQARTSSASDTKSWCAAVIRTNTRFGTMKNKRYVRNAPLTAWKKVVDYTVAHADAYLAATPSEIKTAVKHQIAWFKKVQKNYTSIATTLAPMTAADVRLLQKFQETKCGITFS